jgi:pyruvate,water dikinase
MLMKFFGTPPQPSDEPGVLRGNPGSPGVVRGCARVLRSLPEAAELREGEVLVAETTAPPWTPLFATAAAVVTDTGGILSHSAVVAREYRIPAVVGTGLATATIKSGQTIEVDGDAGIVRVLSETGD